MVKENIDEKSTKDLDIEGLLKLSKLLSELGLGENLSEQLRGFTLLLDEERLKKRRRTIEDSDEYQELLRERDELRRRVDEEIILSDLQKLRQEYPTHRFDSIDDLGEVFCLLRVLGVDCLSAYSILQELDNRTVPRIGQVSPSAQRGDYYTEVELSTLTKGELSKPGVLERALRSLVKK